MSECVFCDGKYCVHVRFPKTDRVLPSGAPAVAKIHGDRIGLFRATECCGHLLNDHDESGECGCRRSVNDRQCVCVLNRAQATQRSSE